MESRDGSPGQGLLRCIIERVHACGPRPVGELLVELLEHSGAGPAASDHLEAWANASPDDVRALEADRFHLPPLVDAGSDPAA